MKRNCAIWPMAFVWRGLSRKDIPFLSLEIETKIEQDKRNRSAANPRLWVVCAALWPNPNATAINAVSPMPASNLQLCCCLVWITTWQHATADCVIDPVGLQFTWLRKPGEFFSCSVTCWFRVSDVIQLNKSKAFLEPAKLRCESFISLPRN